jgi:hypothetical protein
MARRKAATKRRKGLFLAKLEATGSVTKASVAGECARRTWYDVRDRDLEFAEAWDEAEARFMDQCEQEAIKRAVIGVDEEKPYLHTHKSGEKETLFHTVTLKSDRLLELCLKSRHPLYRPVKALEVTSPDHSMSPAANAPNYSNLDDDELQTLTHLQRKLHAGAGGT